MARMGHDSPDAALIYQHATAEADRAIAEAVNKAVKKAQRKTAPTKKRRPDDDDDGSAGVPARVR